MQLARHGKEKKEQEEQGNNPCSMLTLSPRHADIYRARRSLKSEVLRRSRLFLFKFVFQERTPSKRFMDLAASPSRYRTSQTRAYFRCTVLYRTVRYGWVPSCGRLVGVTPIEDGFDLS